ncbi:Clp protease N-terminal domain-containing protein [Streptomyces sp. NPDC021212]|uniref:Clp protease N-terminal domain-containing protein n=1 Tax=Streptomyces sp. NPDC021212 TaxID=3365118 RepID=UPI0037958CBA
MFEGLTDRVRRAMVLAQEEAREHKHEYIGTAHMLLGLIREERSPGAEFLASLGVHVDGLRDMVEDTLPKGTTSLSGQIPFTPEAKRALEDAMRESIALGMNRMGEEHLVLGLMREQDGITTRVLGAYGIDLEAMRERVRETGEFFERFTDRARRALMEGEEAARELKHNHLGTEHILLGLFAVEGIAATALRNLGVSQEAVHERLFQTAGFGTKKPKGPIPFTVRAKKALEMALRDALTFGHDYIGTEHLLLGLIRDGEGTGAQLLRRFAAQSEVRAEVLRILKPCLPPPPPLRSPEPPPVVVGREREIQHIMRILMRKSRNNALLVGEPGTGRTSIVAGLAQRIAQGDVPASLAEVRLWAVDITTALQETVEDPDRTVLFLDDVRAGDADALRWLVRQKPRIIAVTDPTSYLTLQGIGAYVQTVPVGEPTHDEVEILDEAGARVRIADGVAKTVDARHIAESFADRTDQAADEPSVDDRYIWAMS